MHHGRRFIAPSVLLLALALASPVQARGRPDASTASSPIQPDFVANHEVKFGFQYRHTVVTSFTSWPGNKTIADLGDGLAFITRDALYAEKEQIVSGYAGDSIT
jgi:hypothetical protein